MHWSDIFILGVIIGGTYVGTKRGLVLETTDWLMIVLGGTVAFRGYRPLAKALKAGVLAGWSKGAIEWLTFLFFLVPALVGILSLGLHLDRITKEQDRLPPEVRTYGGGVVAFAKYIVLMCIFVGWMPTTGGLSAPDAADFRKGAMVNVMRNLNAPAAGVVRVVAPSDMADKFINEMNKR